MRLRKHTKSITVVLVIVVALGLGFMPSPIYVEVAPVSRGAFKDTIEKDGRTRVIDRFDIAAPVSGHVRRIELQVGDAVAKGQILFYLEPLRSEVLDPRSRATAQARIAAAQNSLRVAQEDEKGAVAGAELAKTGLERIERLVESRHAAYGELDHAKAEFRRAEAAVRSARFAVEVARHELEAARMILEYSAADRPEEAELIQVTSPIKGKVLRRLRESEGAVHAGEVLLEVGSPESLEVIVDVLSFDAVKISPGTAVEFYRWGGDYPLKGVVKRVEPTAFTKTSALGVEEQRVWAVADIVSPPERWQRLGNGYRVEASFILWQGDDVLQIPSNALFRVEDQWAVFVMEKGVAKRRAVAVGRRNGLAAQIDSGLREGELVVTHPSDKVRDNVAIAVH